MNRVEHAQVPGMRGNVLHDYQSVDKVMVLWDHGLAEWRWPEELKEVRDDQVDSR